MLKYNSFILRLKYYTSLLSPDIFKILVGLTNRSNGNLHEHVDAAVSWLCQAQDATKDGGVARSYCLAYNTHFKRKGWLASYPETTGYIIPTLFDYATLKKNRDIFNRAVRMADWEIDIQMENGAVQGGMMGESPSPAIFNTGQVIFGWLRAFKETGHRRYLAAAERAGEFLFKAQDEDGAWRNYLSNFASNEIPFYTYNTRTAWALWLLSTLSNKNEFKMASLKNIEFTFDYQHENGWFENNCLNNPNEPLLHTLAYSIRGILEVGILENNQDYINRAKTAADALISKQKNDGMLAGRFNSQWEPTVSWSCLTGDAQTAIIWGRLFQLTGQEKYRDAMKRANRYLMQCQLMSTKNIDLKGGLCGSDPVYGDYGKFEIVNWAAKFLADSLMLELSISGTNSTQKSN